MVHSITHYRNITMVKELLVNFRELINLRWRISSFTKNFALIKWIMIVSRQVGDLSTSHDNDISRWWYIIYISLYVDDDDRLSRIKLHNGSRGGDVKKKGWFGRYMYAKRGSSHALAPSLSYLILSYLILSCPLINIIHLYCCFIHHTHY